MAIVQNGDYGYHCPNGSFEPYFVAQFNDVPSRVLVRVAAGDSDAWKSTRQSVYVYRWDFATGEWVYLGGGVNNGRGTAYVIGNLLPEGGIIRVLALADNPESGARQSIRVEVDDFRGH
jgi:hypothetical protein